MADVKVPQSRMVPSRGDVLEGLPVRSPQQWAPTAELVNWLLGQGARPVPVMRTGVTLTAGSKYEFSFRHEPRIQTLERLWFVMAALGSTSFSDITVSVNGASVGDITYGAGTAEIVAGSIRHIKETLGSQSGSEESLDLEIDVSSQGDFDLHGIGCMDVPRALLVDDDTDRGVNVDHFRPGQPWIKGSSDNLMDVLATIGRATRRTALINWAVPHTVDGSVSVSFAKSATGTDWADVFDLSIPVLGRKRRIGDTKTKVKWGALIWQSPGTAGARARVFTSKDLTATPAETTSNTSPTWVTGTIDVDAEDLSTSDGLRGGGFDSIQLQISSGDGSTTCRCAAFALWEHQ